MIIQGIFIIKFFVKNNHYNALYDPKKNLMNIKLAENYLKNKKDKTLKNKDLELDIQYIKNNHIFLKH